MDAHHEYVIIARMPVENDGPLLYSMEGLELLEKARKQWAYIQRQRQNVRDREQKQREQRERLKEAGKRCKAKKKAS